MNWAFQRTGGSLWSWRHGAPQGIRAAETRQLSGGSYEVVGDSAVIRPGVPEPLTGLLDTSNLWLKLGALAALIWLGKGLLGGKRGGYKRNPAKSRPKHRRPRRGKAPRRAAARLGVRTRALKRRAGWYVSGREEDGKRVLSGPWESKRDASDVANAWKGSSVTSVKVHWWNRA